MLKQHEITVGMDRIWAELITDFEELNRLFNVNEQINVPRKLVYAVNGLLTLCLNQLGAEQCDGESRSRLL